LENLGQTRVGLLRADSGFYDKAVVGLQQAIKTFTTGLDAAAYENNAMVQAAVERKFEVIGEALSQLSLLDADMAAQLPDLITVVQALLNELGSAFYPCSVLRLQTCASKAPIKSSSAPTGPSQPQSTHK
jgi:hypothetical protein